MRIRSREIIPSRIKTPEIVHPLEHYRENRLARSKKAERHARKAKTDAEKENAKSMRLGDTNNSQAETVRGHAGNIKSSNSSSSSSKKPPLIEKYQSERSAVASGSRAVKRQVGRDQVSDQG